jgi:hypothetical protein
MGALFSVITLSAEGPRQWVHLNEKGADQGTQEQFRPFIGSSRELVPELTVGVHIQGLNWRREPLKVHCLQRSRLWALGTPTG